LLLLDAEEEVVVGLALVLELELAVEEVLLAGAAVEELLDLEPDEPHPATARATVSTAGIMARQRGNLIFSPVLGSASFPIRTPSEQVCFPRGELYARARAHGRA
jgi:hypothetical protein